MANGSENQVKIAVDKILQMDPNNINKSFLEEMFAAYHDKETNTFKEANFDPTTRFELSHDQYQWVDGKVKTSLGRLCFNRYVLERVGIIEHLGYWNEAMNKKEIGKLTREVNNLVLVGKITTKIKGEYIDSQDRFGFWSNSFLSPSISAGLVRPMPDVQKRRSEMFKQYRDDINSDNPVKQIMAVNTIENELVGMVKENLKQDPGYDLYASGVGNLPNNYKNINVMMGAVYNNITKKYDVVESSMMDGIKKKDITAFANSIVAGAYPSAVGTAEAGYMSKIILALLQSEHLDPNPDSDCGTNSTIPITITDSNKQYILFRYIQDEKGKKKLIDLSNVDSFIGQTVRLFSPQCCTHDAICGKCAGRVFYNLGATQVGLLTTIITQKMLNIKLKAKHDLSQSAGIIPDKYVFLNPNDYCHIDDGYLVNDVKMRMFIPRFQEKKSKKDNVDVNGFYRESTAISCLGYFPVKFYDQNDRELFATTITIPAMITFNVYDDIQEDIDTYIVTYDPGSKICSLGIQQNIANVEFFINQIYLHSKIPQIPYNMITEMMFRCLELNKQDLTGPSITYEMLARRLCRSGRDTFAKMYGKNPNIDQMSYRKLEYREAVQESGVLQGVFFEDTGKSLVKGLADSLNGIKPTASPLEKIIKA